MVKGADTIGHRAGWDVERQDNDQYLAHGMDPGRSARQDVARLHGRRLGDPGVRDRRRRDRAARRARSAIARRPRRSRSAPATGASSSTRRPATSRRANATAASRPAPRSSARRCRASVRTDGKKATRSSTRGASRRTSAGSSTRWAGTRASSRNSTASSPTSTPAANSRTTGRATSPRSASRGSTTTRVRRRARKTSCAGSSPTCTHRTPNGEPGNDDLGALSSWYVWAAIGMYPETPGTADLVLASPLFSHVTIALGERAHASRSTRPRASAANRYVQSLHVCGMTRASGLRLAHVRVPVAARVGAHVRRAPAVHAVGSPNHSWGTAPAAAPPSITKIADHG